MITESRPQIILDSSVFNRRIILARMFTHYYKNHHALYDEYLPGNEDLRQTELYAAPVPRERVRLGLQPDWISFNTLFAYAWERV